MGDLADLYRAQRRNIEAEALYERMIPLEEKNLGRDHKEVAAEGNRRQIGSGSVCEPATDAKRGRIRVAPGKRVHRLGL